MRIGRCYRFAWMRNQELYQIVKMQRSIKNYRVTDIVRGTPQSSGFVPFCKEK